MIDKNVNHAIQDANNELKPQGVVDKVIINMPLETAGAEKIAADNAIPSSIQH